MLQVGKPVTGKYLIGRQKEIQLITQLLAVGQSIVLIAPRRFGKTSLVLELLNQLQSKETFISYTDIFSIPGVRELGERITENVLANRKMDLAFRKMIHQIGEIITNVKFRQEIEDFNFILDYQQKSNVSEWELLEKSLDFIEGYAFRHKKKMVAAFDEFGDIQKLDGQDIVKMFRSKIQIQNHTSYIFCGSYESVMEQLFVSSKSPFYRLARVINLGYIEKPIFEEYLKRELDANNLEYDQKQISNILNFTNGHPYYTQLCLQESIISCLLNGKKQIPDIEQLISQLLLIEKNYLEKSWEDVSKSKEERKVITAIANSGHGLYNALSGQGVNVARGLKKLKGKGIIYTGKNGTMLTDPLFNEWIRQNILRQN